MDNKTFIDIFDDSLKVSIGAGGGVFLEIIPNAESNGHSVYLDSNLKDDLIDFLSR